MQYDEALAYLLSLGHETLTAKLGLRNTAVLLEALGNPQQDFPSVQIAGTNGKGSTAVVVDSIVRASGIRSGLYTSPHLLSITERIKIGGKEVPADDFAYFATQVRDISEKLVEQKRLSTYPTFFEQVTAIALLAFKEAKIELAILETGLGGRLDATTCAKAETVAITPIALDHEEYLGETIDKVAAEKAAIIRPGVTAVIAPQAPAVLKIILERCKFSNVSPVLDRNHVSIEDSTRDGRFCISLETTADSYRRVWLGLRGRHQVTNVSLAVLIAEALRAKALDIQRSAIIEGIEKAEHPGRLELINGNPPFLFDGAHNPAGAQALREYLDEFSIKSLTIIFGAMRDKKLEQMAGILFPIADQLVLTQVDNPRTAQVELLRQVAAGKLDANRITFTRSVSEAISAALERTSPRGLICITGSLYLIGEAKKSLLFRAV